MQARRFLRAACGVMYGVAALAILALMGVAFVDIAMRSVSRPLSGAFEVTEVLVGLMVFAALPYVTLSGGHVRVSLLRVWAERCPTLKVALRWLSRLATLLMLAAMAVYMKGLGDQFVQTGAKAVFANLPLAPFAYFAAAMSGLAAVAALFSADRDDVEKEL